MTIASLYIQKRYVGGSRVVNFDDARSELELLQPLLRHSRSQHGLKTVVRINFRSEMAEKWAPSIFRKFRVFVPLHLKRQFNTRKGIAITVPKRLGINQIPISNRYWCTSGNLGISRKRLNNWLLLIVVETIMNWKKIWLGDYHDCRDFRDYHHFCDYHDYSGFGFGF